LFIQLQPKELEQSRFVQDNLSQDTHIPFTQPHPGPQSAPFAQGPVHGSDAQFEPKHLQPLI
jgi:hypothetical protein